MHELYPKMILAEVYLSECDYFGSEQARCGRHVTHIQAPTVTVWERTGEVWSRCLRNIWGVLASKEEQLSVLSTRLLEQCRTPTILQFDEIRFPRNDARKSWNK